MAFGHADEPVPLPVAQPEQPRKWRGVGQHRPHFWRAGVHIGGRRYFLGSAFRSAEAAARAVDRATIAIAGRDGAGDTNFPLSTYPPEVCD